MTKELRNYTVNEFAKEINENETVIRNLINNNQHLSYVSKAYENVTKVVKNSKVAEENREIVAQFIYVNLFNSPAMHRFF